MKLTDEQEKLVERWQGWLSKISRLCFGMAVALFLFYLFMDWLGLF